MARVLCSLLEAESYPIPLYLFVHFNSKFFKKFLPSWFAHYILILGYYENTVINKGQKYFLTIFKTSSQYF